MALVGLVCFATVGAGTFTALMKTVSITVDGQQRQVTTVAGNVAGALAAAGLSVGAHDTLAPAGASPVSDGSQIVLDRARQVELSVDGTTRQLWTTSRTVGDVLTTDGLSVGAHDTLAPAAATPIASGAVIVLDRGRPLELTIDGRQQQVWTTARTVDEALADLGRRTADYQLSADRSRDIPLTGLTVVADRLFTVTLIDGTAAPRTVTVAATTVGGLLGAEQVGLGRYDSVTPAAGAALTDGLAITVKRGAVTRVQSSLTVPQPKLKNVDDDQIDQGSSTVVQKGHPGKQLVSYQVTTVNGAVVDKTEVGRHTVTAATQTIVHVGTRPKLDRVGNEVFFHDFTFGVNWDGLANCESTHNPKAVNAYPSAGLPTYGLFQFDLPTWASVGGSGNPMDASPQEQIMRAKLLYQQRGLEPWACAYAAH